MTQLRSGIGMRGGPENPTRNALFHLNGFCHFNGLCRLGGLDENSGCHTEAVEIRGYSLGVLNDGLYVVKTDLTTFYRLANLRGGTIEFQLKSSTPRADLFA